MDGLRTTLSPMRFVKHCSELAGRDFTRQIRALGRQFGCQVSLGLHDGMTRTRLSTCSYIERPTYLPRVLDSADTN